jgi:hypothetical protein
MVASAWLLCCYWLAAHSRCLALFGVSLCSYLLLLQHVSKRIAASDAAANTAQHIVQWQSLQLQ